VRKRTGPLAEAVARATVLVDLCCPEGHRVGRIINTPEITTDRSAQPQPTNQPTGPRFDLVARWGIAPGLGDIAWRSVAQLDDSALPELIPSRCAKCQKDIFFTLADIRKKAVKASPASSKRLMSIGQWSDAVK
jgi:hypothetical protein